MAEGGVTSGKAGATRGAKPSGAAEPGGDAPPREPSDERRAEPSVPPPDADDQPDFAEEYDHPSGRVEPAPSPDRGVW
jgi:hypothetical protein